MDGWMDGSREGGREGGKEGGREGGRDHRLAWHTERNRLSQAVRVA